jgi:hypothetical protein
MPEIIMLPAMLVGFGSCSVSIHPWERKLRRRSASWRSRPAFLDLIE